uniref:Uncharacterized protein n=1 Tax=Strongyloides stercoralis TaxID=6248 RepID=A0AAF5DEU2_STRER
EKNDKNITRYFHTLLMIKIITFKTFTFDSNFDLKLCIFGDTDTGAMYTINSIKKTLHVINVNNDFTGNNFMKKIEPIAAFILYMVIEGNYSHYDYRFTMPIKKYKNSNLDYFYLFNIINFIGLSSEVYGQYTMNNNISSSFIVLTTENECNKYENLTLTRGYKNLPDLENYFFKYNVDLVLNDKIDDSF